MDRYAYFKTPLRPGDGSLPTSTIDVSYPSPGSIQFDSTAIGNIADDPTDLMDLTASQAAQGVQIFIEPQLGYLEATFAVVDTGVIQGFCSESRQFLIGGDIGKFHWTVA